MQIQKTQFIQNSNIYQPMTFQEKSVSISCDGPKIDTSIYNQKGVSLPFCGVAKAQNALEEGCIKAFRRVRDGRFRKYTEQDIQAFITEIRGGQKDRKIYDVVADVFDVYENRFLDVENPQNIVSVSDIFKYRKKTLDAEGLFEILKLVKDAPDADFVRNVLNLTKGRSESEYYGILEFARHELAQEAHKPLEALVNTTGENKEKFIKILTDINSLDDVSSFWRKDAVDKEIISGLYEDLRLAIYTAEDLPKLDKEAKFDRYLDICSDYKRLKENSLGLSSRAKERVLKLAKDIKTTMEEVICQ